MADVKISELTAQASANVDMSSDVLALVDTSATQTKKISVENLLSPITIDKSAGTITSLGTVTGNLDMQDNNKILLGTGDDLEIYFDGTNTVIDHTPNAGQMFIRADQIAVDDSGGSGSHSPKNYFTLYEGAGAVFNEDGESAHDFRVESNDSANMLFVDGGNNKVLIEANNTDSVTNAATMIAASALEINGNASEGSDILRIGAMADASGGYFLEASNSAGSASYNLLLNPINGGFVGIGRSSNIHEKLHVDGMICSTASSATSSTSGSQRAIMDLTSNGARIGHFRGSNGAGSGSCSFFVDSDEKMRITSAGNVGIGHNSPQYGLTLAQGSADANKIGWEDGSNNKRGAILVSDATDDMHFHIGTSDYTYMRANTSGFVGIGNNVDAAKLLHLRGADATLRINDSTGADWSWDISVGVTADRRFAIKDASGDTEVFYINGNSNDAYFKSSGNSNRAMEIAQNWNGSGDASTCLDLSIGNTNKASYLLRGYNGGSQIFLVTGNNGAVSTTAGTYGTIGSDLRLKENINNATSKLADLNALSVKNFNFIGSEEKYIGFIAQEFEEVFPNLVTTRDTREYDEDDNVVSGYEDTKGLKVGMEFAILVKAIQELSAKVEELQPTEQDDGPVNSVKERVNSLEARVNELENG